MGVIDRVKKIFSKPKESSSTTTTAPQNIGGIKVTDFSSGESVKTTTSPDGTTTRTYRGSPSGNNPIGKEEALKQVENISSKQSMPTRAELSQQNRLERYKNALQKEQDIRKGNIEKGERYTRNQIERMFGGAKGIRDLREATDYQRRTGNQLVPEYQKEVITTTPLQEVQPVKSNVVVKEERENKILKFIENKIVLPTYQAFKFGAEDIGKNVIDPTYSAFVRGEKEVYKNVVKPVYDTFALGAEDISKKVIDPAVVKVIEKGAKVVEDKSIDVNMFLETKAPRFAQTVDSLIGRGGALNVLEIGQKIPENVEQRATLRLVNQEVSPEKAALVGKGFGLVASLNPITGVAYGAELVKTIVGNKATQREKVIATGILGATLLSGGLLKKGNDYSRYLNNPKARVVSYESRNVVNRLAPEVRAGGRASLSITPEEANLQLVTKGKGLTKQVEIYPADNIVRDVREYRRLSTFGKTQAYKGTMEIGDNVVKETIDFGKVRRVVEQRGDDIKVTLTKKNKVLYAGSGKASPDVLSLTDVNRKQDTKPFDIKRFSEDEVITSNVNRQAMGNQGIRLVEPKSQRLTGVIQTRGTMSRDIKKGYTQLVGESYGYQDVIEVGARKSKITYNRNGMKLELSKQKGQQIEFGNPNEIDKSLNLYGNGNSLDIRQISPTQQRNIVEGSKFNVLEIRDYTKSQKIGKRLLEEQKTNLAKKGKQDLKWLKIDKPTVKDNVVRGIKSNKKPIIKQDNNQILIDAPKMVGGTGSQSSYGFDKQFSQAISEELPSVVRVPPSSQYLKGMPEVAISPTPEIVINQGRLKPFVRTESLLGIGIKPSPTESVKSLVITKSDSNLGTDTKTLFDTKLETKTSLDNKQKDFQLPAIKTGGRSSQPQKEELKQEQTQILKLEVPQKEIRRSRQPQGFKNRPSKIKEPIITTFKVTPSVSKLVKMSKERPAEFESFGYRFGKALSLGKRRTKSESEKDLLGFLKSSLGARGFVTRNKQGIKSDELSFLRSKEFRKGKKNPFDIVQKEKFRLGRRDSQTKEIQMFKKKKYKVSNWF